MELSTVVSLSGLGLAGLMLASYILGLLHGATPDEHTWPITFSYSVGTFSTRGGAKAGLVFSGGFTLQRAILTELAYLALASVLESSLAFGSVYVVVGAVMLLAGLYIAGRGKYLHWHYIEEKLGVALGIHRKGSEGQRREFEHEVNPLFSEAEDLTKPVPVRLAFLHGLVAGWGLGTYALILMTVITPAMPGPLFAWIPGALFGLGTMTMQILWGAGFAKWLTSMKHLSREGVALVGRTITQYVLTYGGIIFMAAGAVVIGFPQVLNLSLPTGIGIPNLDAIDIGFLLVVVTVGVLGFIGYRAGVRRARALGLVAGGNRFQYWNRHKLYIETPLSRATMRPTALLSILGLVILLSAFVRPALTYAGPLIVAGSAWGTQSSPLAVEPGSTYVPYTVYLSNAGGYPVENATVEVQVAYPFSLSPGAASELNFTLIPPGATVPASFYIDVAPNASDGVYNVTLFVNYTVVGARGAAEVYNFTQRLQAPVTLYARPVAYLAYWGTQSSPASAYPGLREGTLTVLIGNSGTGPAYNVSVRASAGYPIELVTDSAVVGTIPPGAQIPVLLVAGVAPNATTGEYPLNVTIYYNGGLAASSTVEVPVSLAPSISVQSYGIAQGKAFPGDEDVALQVYLINSGNATAQDVSASLLLPAPLAPAYPGSAQEFVGALNPGQPIPLVFRFDVPRSASSPEDLSAVLDVSYAGGRTSFLVPIRISSLANFSVEPYSAPPLAQGASNVKISYLITNVGNVTAKFVSAQLVLPNGLSGNAFTYVGDLSPGQSGLATFSLDVSSGAPAGNYSAILELTWMQSNAPGRQFTQDVPLELQVEEGYLQALSSRIASSGGLEILAAVVLVVLIAALALYAARARRSR